MATGYTLTTSQEEPHTMDCVLKPNVANRLKSVNLGAKSTYIKKQTCYVHVVRVASEYSCVNAVERDYHFLYINNYNLKVYYNWSEVNNYNKLLTQLIFIIIWCIISKKLGVNKCL